MRYSIMLQVVGIITSIFVGTAGLFAWLQNRDSPTETQSKQVTAECGQRQALEFNPREPLTLNSEQS